MSMPKYYEEDSRTRSLHTKNNPNSILSDTKNIGRTILKTNPTFNVIVLCESKISHYEYQRNLEDALHSREFEVKHH